MRVEINPELEFKITHFRGENEGIVLGGYVNLKKKIQPGRQTDQKKDTELVDVRVNQNNTFNTIINNRTHREER